MGRTSSRVDARERARQARLRIDAEREQRDRKVEDAAAAYFTAADDYVEVAAKLAGIEDRMRAAVKDLLDLGESQTRIATLLGIDTREVRRLRAGPEQSAATAGQSKQAENRASDPQGPETPGVVHNEPAEPPVTGSPV